MGRKTKKKKSPRAHTRTHESGRSRGRRGGRGGRGRRGAGPRPRQPPAPPAARGGRGAAARPGEGGFLPPRARLPAGCLLSRPGARAGAASARPERPRSLGRSAGCSAAAGSPGATPCPAGRPGGGAGGAGRAGRPEGGPRGAAAEPGRAPAGCRRGHVGRGAGRPGRPSGSGLAAVPARPGGVCLGSGPWPLAPSQVLDRFPCGLGVVAEPGSRYPKPPSGAGGSREGCSAPAGQFRAVKRMNDQLNSSAQRTPASLLPVHLPTWVQL